MAAIRNTTTGGFSIVCEISGGQSLTRTSSALTPSATASANPDQSGVSPSGKGPHAASTTHKLAHMIQ
jgi:hypothetical protein